MWFVLIKPVCLMNRDDISCTVATLPLFKKGEKGIVGH